MHLIQDGNLLEYPNERNLRIILLDKKQFKINFGQSRQSES